MNDVDILGVGGRLSGGPADSLVRAAFAAEVSSARFLYHYLSFADIAHVTMLIKAGLIPADRGSRILENLLLLHDDPDCEEPDPRLGDLYTNRASILRSRLGEDAGMVQIGRARREATTIAWQLAVRRMLWELWGDCIGLAHGLHELAQEHLHTIMPDFTYLHHAQATTLSHYLLGFAFPLVRDIERVKSSIALIDRSPAGSGSTNGSALPLDRAMMAELLGFSGVIEHTRDAMWAPDMAIEVMSSLVSTMVNVDRLTEELQLWTTKEFGFLELADSHSRVSVIMPHKKNPYALTAIRGEARSIVGRWSSVVASSLTPSGQPDNRVIAYHDVPDSIDRSTRSIRLLSDVLANAQFDTRAMRIAADGGYHYATDIADHLILNNDVDDATIHHVLGSAIRAAVADGERSLTGSDIRAAAREMDVTLDFNDDDLASLMDPSMLVSQRETPGGAGAGPMDAMLHDLNRRIRQRKDEWEMHRAASFEEQFVRRIVALFPDEELM